MGFLSSWNYRKYKKKANRLYDQGLVDRAIQNYLSAFRIKPDDFDLWVRLSNLCLDAGDSEQIEVLISQCPKASQDADIAVYVMGRLYAFLGQSGQALDCFKVAVEKAEDPTDGFKAIYELIQNTNKNNSLHLIQSVLVWMDGLPEGAITTHYKALFNFENNEYEIALKLFGKAQELGYNLFECSQAKGAVRVQMGDLAGAVDDFKAAVRERSDLPEAHFNLGRVLQQLNDPSAIGCFQKAVGLDENFYSALKAIGEHCFLNSDFEGAIEHLEKAEDLNPLSAHRLKILAKCYINKQDYEEAKYYASIAIERDKNDVEAVIVLSTCLEKTGDKKSAFKTLEALEVEAGDRFDEYTWYQLARLAEKNSDIDASINYLEKAIALSPNWGNGLNALAVQLREAAKIYDARKYAELAVKSEPENSVFLANLALIITDIDGFSNALEFYERALKLQPSDKDVLLYRTLGFLSVKEWQHGWEGYEHRWIKLGEEDQRPFTFKQWAGETLEAKMLLVFREQGLGDEIMFSSCIRDLRNKVNKIVLECDPKLEKLFVRSFKGVSIQATKHKKNVDWLLKYPEIKKQIPIGSLPLHFRRCKEDFVNKTPYLLMDDSKVAYWKSRLDKLGSGLKIGLSWRGGAYKTRQNQRSVNIEELPLLLGLKNVHFINLQYGDSSNDLDEIEAISGVRIHHFQAAIDDYDETAALCGALDLVISVQTALVHLCGALGVHTLCMLPRLAEWRYGSFGSKMDWYPSVKLFRQEEGQGWDDIFKQVHQDILERFLN